MTYRCPEFLKATLDAIEGDERFVMTVGAGVVDSILLACGLLTGNEYVTLTLGTVGIYIGAKGVVEVAQTNADARAAVAQSAGPTGDLTGTMPEGKLPQ